MHLYIIDNKYIENYFLHILHDEDKTIVSDYTAR